MSEELSDAVLEAEVVRDAGGDFPVVTSAIEETDAKKWFAANGVDIDAILESLEQQSGGGDV